ncbi:MAG: hypothetical protein MUC90_07180 [Thermoplasmata archaeon]|nr:hypothetical protein [Thermoplasmata archaeon]
MSAIVVVALLLILAGAGFAALLIVLRILGGARSQMPSPTQGPAYRQNPSVVQYYRPRPDIDKEPEGHGSVSQPIDPRSVPLPRCPACGAAVSYGDALCPKCGRRQTQS